MEIEKLDWIGDPRSYHQYLILLVWTRIGGGIHGALVGEHVVGGVGGIGGVGGQRKVVAVV